MPKQPSIANPKKDKDPGSSSKPSSRMTTRAFEKMQMNETNARLNVSKTAPNRPNSGSSNRSYKDVLAATVPTTVNQFQALQSTSPSSRTSQENRSISAPRKNTSKDSNWSSPQSTVKSVKSNEVVQGKDQDNNEYLMRPRSPSIDQKKRANTPSQEVVQTVETDTHHNDAGWTQVRHHRKSRPRSPGHTQVQPDDKKRYMDMAHVSDNASTSTSVRQGSISAEVRNDINELKENMKMLMTMFHNNSAKSVRSSTTSVHSSQRDRHRSSHSVRSTVSKSATNTSRRSKKQYNNTSSINDQQVELTHQQMSEYHWPHPEFIQHTSIEEVSQRMDDMSQHSLSQDSIYSKDVESVTKNAEFIPNEQYGEVQNRATSSTIQRMIDKPMTMLQPKSNQTGNGGKDTKDTIPVEYYCKKDQDAIVNGDIEPTPVAYRKAKKSKRKMKRSEMHRPRRDRLQLDISLEDDNSDSDGDSRPLFNNNEFSIALGQGKVGFTKMTSFLKDKKLASDSLFELQRMYNDIIQGMSYAFQVHFDIMPSFRQLESTTSFSDIFLHNLCGPTLNRSRAIFDKLGYIIKDLLTSKETISPKTAIKAYRIVQTNREMDGWTILEQIIKGRIPFCRAQPDLDLDIMLAQLTFEENETFHEFYARTQALVNNYRLQYRYERQIPTMKIVRRFIQELMRAPEYVPYLTSQYKCILEHEKDFGHEEQYIQDTLPYTIKNIYDVLNMYRVTETPSILNKSTVQRHVENLADVQIKSTTDEETPLKMIIASYEGLDELQPIIAAFENDPPPNECFTPQICAMRKMKKRCHACLLGFHEEVNCYLRGQAFMPEELRQRINCYNATNGSKPPAGHKFLEYKPSSIAAELPKDKRNSNNNMNAEKKYEKPKRQPFSNNKTKQASVNSMISQQEDKVDQVAEQDQEKTKAVINAFIADQARDVEDNGEFYYANNDDDQCNGASICTVKNSYDKMNETDRLDERASLRARADYSTPPQLLNVIGEFHKGNSNQPNRHFLLQHATKLSKLPNDIYRRHSIRNFQIDGGANVSSVNDRSLFYFFIEQNVSAEVAGGMRFSSPGWGGILIKVGNNINLLSPVHYAPGSPRNIMSTGSLISFSAFRKVSHSMFDSLTMMNNFGDTISWKLETRNFLNFKDIEIMAFDHNLYDMSQSRPVMAPADIYEVPRTHRISKMESILQDINVNEVPDLEEIPVVCEEYRKVDDNVNNKMIVLANGNTKVKTQLEMPTLSPTEISHIASFYINLYPSVSPRVHAINTMNTILGEVNTTLPRNLPIIFTQPTEEELRDADRDDNIIRPIINSKLRRIESRSISGMQEYIHLHLGAMHTSDATLKKMVKRKLLLDLPKIDHEMNHYNCTCTFCLMAKLTKLNKGQLVDYSRMQPFQQLHMDYSFYGHKSIRGMTSALGIICASTSYPFGFPTKSRNPPLEIVTYIIKTIRSMGYEVNFIRVDEDGALAKSAEFCKLIVSLNCILQTTSGGNSESNGKVERPHATQANMVRAALSTMDAIAHKELKEADLTAEDFWCFAYSHAIHTQRRIYTTAIDDVPYYVIHKKRPSAKELVPFGSIVTVVNPSKEKLQKLSKQRAAKGFFLGFGNHVRSLLYWDPTKKKSYKRSYHAIIEDTITIAKVQDRFSSPGQKMDEAIEKFKMFREFDVTDGAFKKEDIETITIPLPTSGTKLGMCFMDDDLFNIPYLSKILPNSPIKDLIPKHRRRNQYVLHINGNSPITVKFLVEHITHLQNDIGEKELHMDLTHRGIGDTSTSLEISRAIFDQLPRMNLNKPVISSLQSKVPSTHMHFVRSPCKPQKPRFFHECLRSDLRLNWIAAAKVAFEKNHRIAVFSLPLPKDELPTSERIFGTTLVPEVKQMDVPGVWELRIRECIIGTKQEKFLDFDNSYSPTVNETTVKLQIAFCAALGYTVGIIDVKNAFQNTISKQENRIFVTVPPTYLEWLAEYDKDFSFDKSRKYVRQMLNANQGTKDAGNQWYTLLTIVLRKYGMIRSTVDHGFFVRDFVEHGKLYVSLATDDLLCGYLKEYIFHDFVQYLRQYFTIVVQTGGVLKFLGIRIIQSNTAISIDQAQYIFELCEDYFGKDAKNICTVSIPMRSDGELEKELYESAPLSEEELLEATLRFKGGYRHHIGKFNFGVTTRFDIQFAVQRLSEYNCAPTMAAFEAIDRIYRYLAQDILRPIIFPKEKFTGSSSITVTLSPNQNATLNQSHLPTLFTDAELARDLQSRRSYYCVVITVLGVIIVCKIRKSSAVMLHTTDSEAQASYDGVRRLQPIRALCEFMGYPLHKPTTHYVDNSAVHQIITSERMTPRCRHFDLPIAFLHEQVGKSFNSELIKTWLQLGDIGTKPLVRALHKRFKYWGSGARFLPDKGSEHYDNLEMQYYECKFSDILQMINSE